MRSPDSLYQWTDEVTTQFQPVLTSSQAAVLALYAFGMFLAKACGLTAIVLALVPVLKQSDRTLRQRLREFYLPTRRKKGRQRLQIDPTVCFAPLLRWILKDWPQKRLALAIDPTNLGNRLTVLTVSVVYRGLAMPVAWKVLKGNDSEAWNPHWQNLLTTLRAALGDGWRVLVLSDRGLESRTLFGHIVALGWHPLMRVKAAGCFRPKGWKNFYRFTQFAPAWGRRWKGRGEAYKSADTPLACTLLACWEEGHTEPWLILTDLPPRWAEAGWYAFRSWIEQGFKIIKREGWQWHRTRMSDPERVERLWLVVALATLRLVQIGSAAEDGDLAELLSRLPPEQETPGGRRGRVHRVFRLGLAVLWACWVCGQGWPAGRLKPENWPKISHPIDLLTEELMTTSTKEVLTNKKTFP